MEYLELVAEADSIEKRFRDGGIVLTRMFFPKMDDVENQKHLFSNWKHSWDKPYDPTLKRLEYSNYIKLFQYIDNSLGGLIGFKFEIRSSISKEGGIETVIRYSARMTDKLNLLVKNFSDIDATIVDAEDYGGILLSHDHDFLNVVNTPEELMGFMGRCTELAEHLKKNI